MDHAQTLPDNRDRKQEHLHYTRTIWHTNQCGWPFFYHTGYQLCLDRYYSPASHYHSYQIKGKHLIAASSPSFPWKGCHEYPHDWLLLHSLAYHQWKCSPKPGGDSDLIIADKSPDSVSPSSFPPLTTIPSNMSKRRACTFLTIGNVSWGRLCYHRLIRWWLRPNGYS